MHPVSCKSSTASQRTELSRAEISFGNATVKNRTFLAFAENHLNTLLTEVPPLSVLVVETSPAQRKQLTETLVRVEETLKSLVEKYDKNEEVPGREVARVAEVLTDRVRRGSELFAHHEIPQDVQPLSVDDQRELARAMENMRHRFWTKLYEVPFVQREAIAVLESLETKQGIVSTLLFPPRTEEYRNASKSERNAILLNAARNSLLQIRHLGEPFNDGIGSPYRQKVASILCSTPLHAERALALAAEVKRKGNALIDAEMRPMPAGASDESQGLERDIGASPLQVRGFLSELTRLQEPYMRLKNYTVMSLSGMARSEVNRKVRGNDSRREDLLQSCMVGIMRGVERFDPAYGNKITTNTFEWLTHALRMERSAHAFAVSIPHNKQAEFFKIRALSEEAGSVRSLVEIATEHGVSADDTAAYVSLVSPAHSLDSRAENGGRGTSRALSEIVADPKPTGIDSDLEMEDLRARLSAALKVLNRKERQVLSMHFGLDGIERRSDVEIGAVLGITKDRVAVLRRESLFRLSRNPDAKRIHEQYASQ